MKKKHVEEEEKLERWLVSYADFITLLFAFFTVLYALSQADKAKYKTTAENIQRAFLSAGGIFPLKGAPFTPFEKAPDRGAETPPSPLDAGKLMKKDSDSEALDRINLEVKNLFEKTTGLNAKMMDMEVLKTEEGFKIRLAENTLYKPGSDKLRRENVPFILALGKKLSRLGVPIQIEGHTDATVPSGGISNWQLSVNRAYNILRFLVEGVGYPKNKISLAGYGDTQPISDNGTPEGRARNRRVEIAVFTGSHQLSELPW